ncbi:MAG: SCP2 sterol-binding domain-containing protein [Methylococcales bacterium]|nr:SCP2 sterol-binding domain-containing protein [Methylococcales bacterium]
MTIKPLIIATLESAINRYLSLDDNVSNILAPLVGKVVAITITPFNETIYLCPTTDSIQCLDYLPQPADTHLTGSLMAFGLMGLSGKPMNALFSGEVTMEGDTRTGRKFQELFDKLDINLEGKLARYTGETVAHNLAEFFRAGKNWSKESLETFKLNTSEFLQEETQELPAVPEADIFYAEVDELRTDLDRLQSRIERLENHYSKK